MANISAESQAIIDRLKAEGDLIRNRGKNSVRAVNIKLDKFEGLFSTISQNVAQQTQILKAQASIDKKQFDKAKTDEQLQEIESKKTESNKNITNEKIEEMGDKITKKLESLSFKSILGTLAKGTLLGGGLFLAYNFIKGFVNKMFDGAFDKFESSVGDLTKKIKDFSIGKLDFKMPDFAQLQKDFEEMKATFTKNFKDLNTNIASAANSLKNISDAFDKIKNLSWLGLVVQLGLAFESIRTAVKLIGLAADLLKKRVNRIPIPKDPPKATPPPSGTKQDSKQSKTPPVEKTPPRYQPGRGPTTPGPTAPKVKPSARLAARSAPPGVGPTPSSSRAVGVIENNNGRVVNSQGKPISPSEVLKNLRKGLSGKGLSGKLISGFNKLGKFLLHSSIAPVIIKIFGAAAIGVAIYEAYGIIVSGASFNDKVKAIGALIGSLVGGFAVGAIVAAIGSSIGPWGTIVGFAVGADVGSKVGAEVGIVIARWVFDIPESKEERERRTAETERAAAAVNGFDADAFNQTAPASSTSASPKPGKPRGGSATNGTGAKIGGNAHHGGKGYQKGYQPAAGMVAFIDGSTGKMSYIPADTFSKVKTDKIPVVSEGFATPPVTIVQGGSTNNNFNTNVVEGSKSVNQSSVGITNGWQGSELSGITGYAN